MQLRSVHSARTPAGLPPSDEDLSLRTPVLPSMATTWASKAGNTPCIQRRNAASKWPGSISPNSRPKVSCEAMPWTRGRYRLSQSSFSSAQISISTKVSAPASTAATATTSNSTRSCSTLAACRGSSIDTNTSASRNRMPDSVFSMHIQHQTRPTAGNNLAATPVVLLVLLIHAIALMRPRKPPGLLLQYISSRICPDKSASRKRCSRLVPITDVSRPTGN